MRLVRVEDFLRGHCVGAELIGAHFPMSPDEDDALLALGWHHPTPTDGEDYVRFWPDDVPQGPFLPRDEAERAAAMVAATFRDVLAVGADDAAGRRHGLTRPVRGDVLPSQVRVSPRTSRWPRPVTRRWVAADRHPAVPDLSSKRAAPSGSGAPSTPDLP